MTKLKSENPPNHTMKILGITISSILLCIIPTCSTITPDQTTQYAAAHTVISGGLQDYKTIKAVSK